ncbi:hypothetical protein ACB092_01G418900 [Castanea dentata]
MCNNTSGAMVNQTESVLAFRLVQRSHLSQKNLLNQSLRMNLKKKPKKEEPAKPKPEAGAEEEEAPKPKPKNPLHLLPPSKMILDCWKRLYSNTKTNFREVSGFLQSMNLACKYAFGKMLVIGSEPPFKVKLLWLLCGQDIPKFVLDESYDMKLYEWKKVDCTDEEQKERVSQMIEDYEP